MLQETSRGLLGKQGAPELNAGPGPAHAPDGRQGRTPGGNLIVILPGRTVQGLGDVRQDDPRQAKIRQDFLEIPDIRGGDEPRQQVHRAGWLSSLGQLLHHRLNRGMKALHVGAAIAGG
jgi:hypothetical protein